MADRRDDIWEGRADRAYSQVTYHPWRIAFICLLVVILLGVVGLVGGCFSGWASGTANLVSFQHSEEQTTAVLTDVTNMQAAACNYADAVKAAAAPSSNDPVLIESPGLAYAGTYRSIQADYDRRMNNLFEAYVTKQLPLPGALHGLPRLAPSLKEAVASC